MKIKAFTIAELTVALAISAIVISVGYYSFRIIGNTVEMKGSNLSQIEDLNEFRFLLQYDLFQYHDWITQDGSVFFSKQGSCVYTFGNEKINRNFNGSDADFEFSSVILSKQSEGTLDYKLILNDFGKEYILYFQIRNNLVFGSVN